MRGLKFIVGYLISLVLSVNLYAQNVPEQFKLPITFIAVKDVEGKLKYNGTGFIASIPLDSANLWLYLVTAKHVIVDEADNRLCDTIWVRINSFENSSYVLPIELYGDGPDKDVYFHSDTSVDLAVIGITANTTLLNFRSIGESSLFKSKTEFDTSYVKEGTNVFYTSMFSPYLGYKKNSPIVRFGKVSLITDEKLLWDSAKNELANLFLVETTTFGGNSGSPVFSYEMPFQLTDTSNHHNFSKDSTKMIGVIKGSYLENMPMGLKQTSAMVPTYTSNVGISGVIPSYLLYEILHSDELERIRKNLTKKSKNK